MPHSTQGINRPLSLVLLQQQHRGVAQRALHSLMGRRGSVAVVRTGSVCGPTAARRTAIARAFRLWMDGRVPAACKPWMAHLPNGKPQLMLPLGLQGRFASRHAHISVAHDGGVLAILLGGAPGLCGVGVDVVDLRRVRPWVANSRRLRRFLSRLMDEPSATRVAHDLIGCGEDDRCTAVAVRFGLMEAVSKALGTGWTLGSKLGDGVPCKSIGLAVRRGRARVVLREPAIQVLRRIRGRRIEASWVRTGDLVVAVAVIWGS